MLILTNSGTDKLQLVTSAALAVDVHASWQDLNGSTVTPGRTNTAISTATTTDIVGTPGSSTVRNVKTLHVRNKGASALDVTVVYDQNGTDFELHKATLLAGDTLEYVEGVGFYTLTAVAAMNRTLRLTSDYVNATTSFSDITGLSVPVQSGKHYNFLIHLYHINNATTTGSRFAVNGPTMSSMILSTIDTVTASVTASTHSAGTVSALDTAATAQTTGSAGITLAILSGWINPSADGTFVVRGQSEVAVAAGLTVKAGSWMRIWEPVG